MLENLKRRVCDANLRLAAEGLAVQTFGNASGIDRPSGNLVIKPSGMSYDRMKPEHMVVVSLNTGKVVEGTLNPSSDTPTHLVLYRAFADVGGVVHTHSLYATAWAQAHLEIPALGTTHADYFRGTVPCTAAISDRQIAGEYEEETAVQIVEAFRRLDYREMPAMLVASHSPFTWGRDAAEAVYHATMLEYAAEIAAITVVLNPRIGPAKRGLVDRHFLRKHGAAAYYGQSGA